MTARFLVSVSSCDIPTNCFIIDIVSSEAGIGSVGEPKSNWTKVVSHARVIWIVQEIKSTCVITSKKKEKEFTIETDKSNILSLQICV